MLSHVTSMTTPIDELVKVTLAMALGPRTKRNTRPDENPERHARACREGR
jgi:hypothetical protein